MEKSCRNCYPGLCGDRYKPGSIGVCDNWRPEYDILQQQLSLSQKAVEVLADSINCLLDLDIDCYCGLDGEESIEQEEKICLKCKLDYAYAKAREKEGER